MKAARRSYDSGGNRPQEEPRQKAVSAFAKGADSLVGVKPGHDGSGNIKGGIRGKPRDSWFPLRLGSESKVPPQELAGHSSRKANDESNFRDPRHLLARQTLRDVCRVAGNRAGEQNRREDGPALFLFLS